MGKSPKDRRGTAQNERFALIFALPPVPHYEGRSTGKSSRISGAQNLSGFYRFIPGHWALALQKLPLVRFHLCAWVCRANGGGPNPVPPKPSPRGEGGWPPGQTDEGADFGPLVGAAPCSRSETPRLRFPCRGGCAHPPAVPPPHNLSLTRLKGALPTDRSMTQRLPDTQRQRS